MDQFLIGVMQMGALSSFRQDDTVARQGVMNHQTSAHLMDLSFIRDATELSIPESYAIQGLQLATLPVQTAGMNLGSITPPGYGVGVNK